MIACAANETPKQPIPTIECGTGAYADEVLRACLCDPGFFGNPDVECAKHDDVCAKAAARVQHTVCAHTIDNAEQWTRMSVGGGLNIGGLRRLGKYMVPVDETSRLPPVFSDANSYRLHYCLMSAGFEPLFPGLTTAEHAALLLTHTRREFYAGAIYEFRGDSETPFGFSVETASREDELLPVETIYSVYRQLSDRFEPGELGYLPRGTLQTDDAATWTDAPFVVLSEGDDPIAYEGYTPGIAYGRVRLSRAGAPVEYGWQDVVVFDEVPVDWEGVMAAAVTGQRQDILSHLNVLSAQRGTPNFYVDDATAVFSQFEGQLVRVEAEPWTYKLTLATEAEAQAFWDAQRPSAAVENPATFDHTELDSFATIATQTREERDLARARFGAKTVGLATLSALIDRRYQTPGFGVPFGYYDAFMRDNAWSVDLGDGPVTLSYAETIVAWLGDDSFMTDARVRKERLAAFRDEMRDHGVVSPGLVAALRERITQEFGSETTMVRFRSSSNAEDTPTFNGAGLYDSTSACAADSFGPPDALASACDPDQKIRTIERALAKVWASLWRFGAFEERDYYQLDHTKIAMGVTVSQRFDDELANGVAFTGNPLKLKQRQFTINAQRGEVDVVNPMPGVTAELSYLKVTEGSVESITRAVASTLVEPGELVVSDAHLRELGGIMAGLQTSYPVDYDDASQTPLLDLEFKITDANALVIKQIRTFLPSPYASDPTCREP